MICFSISQIWYLIYKEQIFQLGWRESGIWIQHWNPAAGLLGLVVQNCSRLYLNLYYNFKKPAFQDLGMTHRDRHKSGSRRKISSFLHFQVQKIILHCIRCSIHKIILLLMSQFQAVVAGQTSFIDPKVIGINWLAGVKRMHDVSWPSIIPSYHSGCNVQPCWPWISHKKVKNVRGIKG